METSEKALRTDLETVMVRFAAWRATRKSSRGRIPEELWKAALGLTSTCSIHEVAKTLHLNHTDLKKRIFGKTYHPLPKKYTASFIELPREPIFTQSECVIEMEDKTGCRMKMVFRGETHFDLLELGKSFWNKR